MHTSRFCPESKVKRLDEQWSRRGFSFFAHKTRPQTSVDSLQPLITFRIRGQVILRGRKNQNDLERELLLITHGHRSCRSWRASTKSRRRDALVSSPVYRFAVVRLGARDLISGNPLRRRSGRVYYCGRTHARIIIFLFPEGRGILHSDRETSVLTMIVRRKNILIFFFFMTGQM